MSNFISPLDDRYKLKVQHFAEIFSESNLNKTRTYLEIEWLIFLCTHIRSPFPTISKASLLKFRNIYKNFDNKDARKVKQIEKTTNHDVKAVEYFIRNKIKNDKTLGKYENFVHFGLTSEDINSSAYALMINEALKLIYAEYGRTLKLITNLSLKGKDIPLLSRTHGQAASPTTFGKEFKIFQTRLTRQLQSLPTKKVLAKWGGASGNFHTFIITKSNVDWLTKSKKFLNNLNIPFNDMTTQIEPHDCIADISHQMIRCNNILLDMVKDIWLYIANDLFLLKKKDNEVGSSTMPHKVNPIDFENAEGNLGVANALLDFFANKLPQSRLQRDLSDSTVLRNYGLVFGYTSLALSSINKGLEKLQFNIAVALNELDENWQVLAEPLQIILKLDGVHDPYNLIKEYTRGKKLDKSTYLNLINDLPLSISSKNFLSSLTPATYLGLAKILSSK
ncbi:MAG: adenylosuccinate lyase [Gammaproteobacteria bacterium]